LITAGIGESASGHLPDSSQMNPKIWRHLLKKVSSAVNSKNYQGIVITHGTDTLAYSAAVLTFALSFLPIPVVMTAAQSFGIPIY
jgi:L-asparaginase